MADSLRSKSGSGPSRSPTASLPPFTAAPAPITRAAPNVTMERELPNITLALFVFFGFRLKLLERLDCLSPAAFVIFVISICAGTLLFIYDAYDGLWLLHFVFASLILTMPSMLMSLRCLQHVLVEVFSSSASELRRIAIFARFLDRLVFGFVTVVLLLLCAALVLFTVPYASTYSQLVMATTVFSWTGTSVAFTGAIIILTLWNLVCALHEAQGKSMRSIN